MSESNQIRNNIINFPMDSEELRINVDKLRTELSMLVLERDTLLYQECKDIEMAYLLSFGALEYKAYELECAILRQKRKIELIQAKKNRQEKVIVSEIEAMLDVEFAEYQEKLNEQIAKMNEAMERSRLERLSELETQELKRLYRLIVKALHPDLHPDLSSEKLELFYHAVEAYKRGDIEGLEIISAMVAEPVIPNEKPDAAAFLAKEKERLLQCLQKVRQIIDKIKSEYPYTVKAIVQCPEKAEALKLELESRIKVLNDLMAAYIQQVEEMLR